MNDTYEWLYDYYAAPLLKELEESENEQLEHLSKSLELSEWGRVQLFDRLSNMRFRWGAEVFAMGLQMGVRLTAPRSESGDGL